jgi:Rieske Fe-S protein
MRVMATLLLTCLATVAASGARAGAADTTLGTGVTLETTTPIADVIASPAGFAGQTIRVEGVVTAVCQHMGCWMTLAPAGATGGTPATLRLKVDDGVIVFPVSSRGRTAVAQGVIERAGGDADAAEVAANAGPATYQLKVTGATLR